ncbi:hypothetical protein Rpal_0665 [Rhodopseudomonas palustris TIE-1]|nr:hypothetical protein Rpal_0665 [Rhodopseudomonas palustris TIE-1]
MRLLVMAIVGASAALVSGCSTKPADEPTVLLSMTRPTVPETAKQKCDDPVPLPDRDLTERETASAWGRDRSALRTCEGRRAAAVEAIEPQQ